jgi:alpha-methylacyl-CoA racemase
MSQGPLHGFRIVEFEGLGPTPFCGMFLAGLGADVLRIVRDTGGSAYADVGGAILFRGRPAVAANLKSASDRAAVMQLIGKADALLEGYRPGVLERLGLGPAPALAANPRLVYARMTGWGQTGPLSPRAGHDINYIAIAGALHAIGKPGEPPTVPLNLVGDYGGGAMFLATGVLAALLAAERSGIGQVVDVAMTDGTALLMSLFQALAQAGEWRYERGANLLDGGRPFYRCYECADGRHVAVGALEPQFYAALLRLTGIAARPEIRTGPIFGRSSRPSWTPPSEPKRGMIGQRSASPKMLVSARSSAWRKRRTTPTTRPAAPSSSATPSHSRPQPRASASRAKPSRTYPQPHSTSPRLWRNGADRCERAGLSGHRHLRFERSGTGSTCAASNSIAFTCRACSRACAASFAPKNAPISDSASG